VSIAGQVPARRMMRRPASRFLGYARSNGWRPPYKTKGDTTSQRSGWRRCSPVRGTRGPVNTWRGFGTSCRRSWSSAPVGGSADASGRQFLL
jgi:hypothetical protein